MSTMMVQQKHSCGAGCSCGRNGTRDSGTVAQRLRTTLASLKGAMRKLDGVLETRAIDQRVGEVEREMATPENRNVFAMLDTETGEVRAFMATPTAPGSTEDPAELPLGRLSDTKRRELELQLEALRLIADDKMSSERVRRNAAIDAIKIEKVLELDGQAPGRVTPGVYPRA